MSIHIEDILKSFYISTGIPFILLGKNMEIKSVSTNNEIAVLSFSEVAMNLIHETKIKKKNHLHFDRTNLTLSTIYIDKTSEIILFSGVFLGDKLTQKIRAELIKQDIGSRSAIIKYFNQLKVFSKDEFMRDMDFICEIVNNKGFFKNYERINSSKFELFIKEINVVDLDKTTKGEHLHDSYKFEQILFSHIQSGNKLQLIRHLTNSEIGEVGNLSVSYELRNMKNQFIVACTLASRAAINGGLSPDTAYSISDYYINKVEEINDVEKVGSMVDEMFLDYTERVSNIVNNEKYSKSINEAIIYIKEHILEQIDTNDICDYLGISKDYLLKKFKRETGESLVIFIQRLKISEAKLMLQYSNFSLIEISEYLSFSNQSYFTQIFRKLEGVTPKEFRDKIKNKPKTND
ncbi:helix-turn-helix domain-containing protein [[Eubacterium] hominis]|uniref:helix-turn-helix domain-containing protein n=1 Tax=[Eubacterium] hominis TaxID=2764325 RepID=UPI003A4D300A